jgi:putative addiction module killer protein
VESANKANLKRTNYFHEWLNGLKDYEGKRRIEARIKNAEAGNFGEVESVGDGVYEMKFKTIGYRLYFCRRGPSDYLLSLLQNLGFRLRPSTSPSAQARPALFQGIVRCGEPRARCAYQLRWSCKTAFCNWLI